MRPRARHDLGRRLDALEGKGTDEEPLAFLHLPDNGRDLSRDLAGPKAHGCIVIHELGCAFCRWRCAGPPNCPSVPPIAELTDKELAGRVDDLEHLRRTHSAGGPMFQARMAELEALTAELTARVALTVEDRHA
jgi:hypothetical protein